MTRSRPTRSAKRRMRSATSWGCSTTLVAWLTTPGRMQGCPGKDRLVVVARQAPPRFSDILLVDETQNGELGVRYKNTVLGDLLKVLPRRRFAAIVERHKGDKYIKGFSSWDPPASGRVARHLRQHGRRGRNVRRRAAARGVEPQFPADARSTRHFAGGAAEPCRLHSPPCDAWRVRRGRCRSRSAPADRSSRLTIFERARASRRPRHRGAGEP